MKTCSKCGQEKNLKEFYNGRADCIICRKKYQSEYDKSHYVKRKRKPQKLLPHSTSMQNRASRANYKAKHDYKIPGKLKTKDIRKLKQKTGDFCLSCGRKFDGTKLYQWSIDHIIPFNHPDCINEISNIQIICFKCNTSKNDNIIDYKNINQTFNLFF